MDYLLRDSYFAGVTYGVYDMNRIYSSFQAAHTAVNGVGLCVRESGFDSVLRFIQCRTHASSHIPTVDWKRDGLIHSDRAAVKTFQRRCRCFTR